MEIFWITVSATILVLQRGSHAKKSEYLKTNSEAFCPQEWHSFGLFCYRGFSDKLTFEDAEKECVKHGGHLASITSSEMQEFVTAKVLIPLEHRAYLGLKHNESINRSHWSDGSQLDFIAWDANEPSGKSRDETDEHCVEMTFNNVLNRLGKWNDISCNQKIAYICQKLKDSETEKPEKEPGHCSRTLDGISFRNSCFHLSLHLKTWEEAEKYCVEQFDGHLASVTDAAAQKFLHYELANHQAQHSRVWIGAQLQPDEVVLWSSGWYLGYTNWRDKKEHKKVSSKSCAAMTRDGRGEWTLSSCGEELSFICENSSVIPPPKLKPTVPGLKCPFEDWIDLGGDYCYIFDRKNWMSWYNANFFCMRKGGALASIHSKQEEQVLAQFFRFLPDGIHIGLYRQDRSQRTSGEFGWVDHSPFNYENWRYGEPNSKDEMCAEALPLQDMKWNDNKCDDANVYVCSVAKIKAFPNGTEETETDSKKEKSAFPNNTEETETYSKKGESGCLPTPAIVGVVLCVLVVVILLGVVFYNLKPWMKARQENKNRKSSFVRERPRYRTDEMVISEQISENMDSEMYYKGIDKNARCTSLPY